MSCKETSGSPQAKAQLKREIVPHCGFVEATQATATTCDHVFWEQTMTSSSTHFTVASDDETKYCHRSGQSHSCFEQHTHTSRLWQRHLFCIVESEAVSFLLILCDPHFNHTDFGTDLYDNSIHFRISGRRQSKKSSLYDAGFD